MFNNIYAINPYPDPLPQSEGFSLPMIGNSFLWDGVLDVPNRLAKNQNIFTDNV